MNILKCECFCAFPTDYPNCFKFIDEQELD